MSAIHFDHFGDFDDDEGDAESIASLESDHIDYPVERVIAEYTADNGHKWFLCKWENSPLVRSSWECSAIFEGNTKLLSDWKLEKKNQEEGKSKPFDIVEFNRTLDEIEAAERQRRTVRRLRRQVKGVLTAVTNT